MDNINGTDNTLRWRHNGRDSVSNHQPHVCLLNRLFRRRSKKTSKLRVTGLCAGISPETGEFPAQKASNAENVSIWWRHHASILINRNKRRQNGNCVHYRFGMFSTWQLGGHCICRRRNTLQRRSLNIRILFWLEIKCVFPNFLLLLLIEAEWRVCAFVN